MGYRLDVQALWPISAALSGAWMVLEYRARRSVYLAGMLLFFFVGVTVCTNAANPVLPPAGKYRITAQVKGETEVRQTDSRAALYIKEAVLCSETGESYRINRLYWTFWPEEGEQPVLYDGQTVTFTGKVYHPSGQENPYGFDFRLYLLQKGVTAGVSGADDLIIEPTEQTAHKSVLLRLRLAICDRLELLLGDQAPLACALLIGETEEMPEKMRNGFRRAGVAHVLSVSGLHAMLIMGVVIRLLKRLQASPRVVFSVTGVLLIFYSLLVGAKAPILRAAVLVTYQLYAHMARRRSDTLTAWALGVMIVLLIQPLQLFSAGFQMSFAAVLGMIMLGDALRPYLLRRKNSRTFRLRAAYCMTLCANLGVLLPMVCAYNRVSLIGLLINPLVCLLAEVLMILDVFLLALSLVSVPLAQQAGAVLAYLSRFAVDGIGLAGSFSWAGIQVASPPWYLAAAIAGCLILCTRYVRLRTVLRLILGGAVLTAACAVLLLTQNRDVRYIQLALGNADAAVIEDGRETIVIDTGEHGGDLSSYLLATGRHVDHLVLTHLHADHALGLVQLLEEDVPIDCVYLSTEALKTETSPSVLAALAAVGEKEIPVRLIRAGEGIATRRVAVDVRWPEEGSGHQMKDANDCAMSLMIDLDGVSMLHMSDVTGTYERYTACPADILRAAHHGSAGSTQKEFLQCVAPRVCLISGDDPAAKTLGRLADAAVMVYDTGRHGAITVTVHEGQYTVQGYLQ